MSASEFKAKCLAVLDEVARSGRTITILKRGKPVAKLVPVDVLDQRTPQDRLRGTVHELGDIVSPAIGAERWEALRD